MISRASSAGFQPHSTRSMAISSSSLLHTSAFVSTKPFLKFSHRGKSTVSKNPARRRILIRCQVVKRDDDDDDAFYMRRCVELARSALGHTSPNPMVGCVIVRDGEIVGEGFHPKAGQPHAEVILSPIPSQGRTIFSNLVKLSV